MTLFHTEPTQSRTFSTTGDTYQFADILAPDLAGAGLFGHEGHTVQLREEVVQTLHAGPQRKIRAVQTGLYVVPAMSKTSTTTME